MSNNCDDIVESEVDVEKKTSSHNSEQVDTEQQSSNTYTPDDEAKVEIVKSVLDDVDVTNPELESSANINVDLDPFKYLTEQEWKESRRKSGVEGDIPLPATTFRGFAELIDKRPSVDISTSEHGRNILQLLKSAYRFCPRHGTFLSRLSDANLTFSQFIDSDGLKLGPGRPKYKEETGNTRLEGEAALLRICALRGKGGLFSFPLWHSGFWVTIKTPHDPELLDLETEIMRSEITLGRSLLGASFSADQVYLVEAVLNLFQNCLYSSSLTSNEDIFDKIKVQDIQTIAWGLACAIHPNGYHFSRAIVSDDVLNTPDRVLHGKVDLAKLCWVANENITAKQRRHMARRHNPVMSPESLQQYQDDFNIPMRKRVSIADDIDIVLEVPSVSQHLEMSENWINANIEMVEKVLSEEDRDNKRNDEIIKYTKTNLIGQYRHYIKSFIYKLPNSEEEYDDSDTVDLLVKQFSSEPDVRMNFFNEIFKFIDETQVSIIATPTVDGETGTLAKFPNLVPMDALYTFFILAIWKAQAITSR